MNLEMALPSIPESTTAKEPKHGTIRRRPLGNDVDGYSSDDNEPLQKRAQTLMNPPTQQLRQSSLEFSPSTVCLMAEDLGLVESMEPLPAAYENQLFSRPQLGKEKGESPLAVIEAKVREQHKSWKAAMAAALHDADVTTHNMFDWVVHNDDPQLTVRFVSRFSPDKLKQLHPPMRPLMEGLQGRIKKRVISIREQRQRLLGSTGWAW